jgi:hypothetical protein
VHFHGWLLFGLFTVMLFVQALDGPASLRFLSALFKSREPGCDPPDIVA